MNNERIRYKIEVDGITSFAVRIPATINSGFIEGEIVTGFTSGASAVVVGTAGIADQYIYIKTKIGFFLETESLIGSVAGNASKTGDTETTEANYNNATYGIVDGLWTINSHESLLSGMSDPMQSINVSGGGNLGTSSKFTFNVRNKDIIKTIEESGVYFNQRVVTFYIGFMTFVPDEYGDYYTTNFVKFFTGSIDSIKLSGERDVQFSCGDLTRNNIENIGSDTIPISLNRNYNCKLPLNNQDFQLIEMYYARNYGEIINVTSTEKGTKIQLRYSSMLDTKITGGDFDNVLLYVIQGTAKDSLFYCTGAEKSGSDIYVYIDSSDADTLPIPDDSIIELRQYYYTLNISNKEVQLIHELDNNVRKKIRSVNSNEFFDLTNDMYSLDTNKIIIKNLSDENELYAYNSLDYYDTTISTPRSGFNNNPIVTIDKGAHADITEFCKSGDNYIKIKYTILDAVFSTNPNTINNNEDDYTTAIFMIEDAYCDIVTSNLNPKRYDILDVPVDNLLLHGNKSGQIIKTMKISMSNGSTANNYNMTFEGVYWRRSKDRYQLQNLPLSNALNSINIQVIAGVNISEIVVDPAKLICELSVVKNEKITFDYVTAGCNGENVSGLLVDYDTVPNTLKYMLTNYYGKSLSDIDLVSFSEAEADYSLFVNNTARNASYQLTSQENANKYLKDLLWSQNLGCFVNSKGQYQLENFIAKSIVFGNSTADATFNETSFISLSPIFRDQSSNIVTDFEIDWGYNEGSGKYENKTRIKNTHLDVFDFETCTEGVDSSDYALAFSAWQLGKAGRNRLNRDSQTQKSTKWIKPFNSDGTGSTELLSFVRTLMAHLNHDHRYIRVKIPLTLTNIQHELLSFIGVSDLFITGDVEEKGWIVERKLNVKDGALEFKLLLDVNKFDPFLYKVNIWADGTAPTNLKIDGSNPTNIKKNGTGI